MPPHGTPPAATIGTSFAEASFPFRAASKSIFVQDAAALIPLHSLRPITCSLGMP